MMNSVNLTGRLTRDPELRYTSNGHAVTNFTLAVNRKGPKEEGKQDVDFLTCVAWRGLGETMANHLQKGSLIGVEGRLQARKFTYKDGEVDRTAFVTEILVEDFCFLEAKRNVSEIQQFQSKAN
jgi:single-strand DNA-binding protein